MTDDISNALRLARKPRATGGAGDGYSTLINDLYQGALGRGADEAGSQFWQGQLSSGSMNAGDLAKALLGSEEAKGYIGTSLDDLYRGYTGSNPDAEGKQFWQTQIAQSNSTLSDVENALAAANPGKQYQLPDMQVGTINPIPRKYLNQLPGLIEKAYTANQTNPANYNYANSISALNSLINDYGMTPIQAAAYVGNFSHEAQQQGANPQLNFGQSQYGGSGIGAAQWTDPARKQALMDYAKSIGKDWTSPVAQMGFVNQELQSPEYQRYNDYIKSNPDLASSVAMAGMGYERPANLMASIGNRYQYALETLRQAGYNPDGSRMTPEQIQQMHPIAADPFTAGQNIGQTLTQQGAGGNVAGFTGFTGATPNQFDITASPTGYPGTTTFPTSTTGGTFISPGGAIPGTGMPSWDYSTGLTVNSPSFVGSTPGMSGYNPIPGTTGVSFFKNGGAVDDALRIARASGGGAWTRKEGKNPNGGLNEKGRASLRAQGHDIKRPQPEGGARRDSFCARMKGMKEKLTSAKTANDPDSRINKSLRAWNCHKDGGAVDDALHLAKYPMRDRKDWDISHDYESRGGDMTEMSPDEFLHRSRPLHKDKQTKEDIEGLKHLMEQGREFDPLQLLGNGLEDGRHRATAAKELGIDKVPVIDFRADGGQVWDKPRPKNIGKPEKLSSKEKASAKRAAKDAGRPYPNLIDNMRAAKAGGGDVDNALRIAKRAK